MAQGALRQTPIPASNSTSRSLSISCTE
jgi:hypothetical protein